MGNDNIYETTDLGLTASLVVSGFRLERLNRDNPRRVVFVFRKTADLQKHVDGYWSHELMLPAALLLEQVRLLKSRIYGG